MSAEAVGRFMPGVITLDDLAAMMTADTHGYRYETSVEGALSVVPPPDSEHAVIATRLMAWLIAAGLPLDQIMQVAGVRIPGPRVDAGRIPDLTIWSRPQPRAVWLAPTDLRLVIEIISPASAAIDQLTKVQEYASAKIGEYWTVDRDADHTVTVFRLGDQGIYRTIRRMPLTELLASPPHELLPPL